MAKNNKPYSNETIETAPVEAVESVVTYEVEYNELKGKYTTLESEVSSLKSKVETLTSELGKKSTSVGSEFKYAIGTLVMVPVMHGQLTFEVRSHLGYTLKGTPLYYLYNREFGRDVNYVSEESIKGA